MGDVVNLRQARKAKERKARESAAASNRSRFGVTRQEKAGEVIRRSKVKRELDGSRREKTDKD